MRIDVVDAAISFSGRTVFSGLDASAPSRRITAVIGPSGSGKTSLLSAMAGYRQLDRGEIRFVTGRQHTPPTAEHVVWIPQGSNALPARTAIDNAMLGAQARGESFERAAEQARKALKQVGLLERADSLARQLSGGELQRLSFARALAASQSIVFADEPTASLDLANIRIIAGLLRQLSGKATIVVATHDPLLIDAADHVIDLRGSA